MNTPKVHIYGLGNVGYHLYLLFRKQGINLGFIFSDYSNDLCVATLKKEEIDCINEDDIVFVTTSDKLIIDSVEAVGMYTKNVVITSGGINLKDLPDFVSVFYPLYSFNKYNEIDWGKVPVFLEYNNEIDKDLQELIRLLEINTSFLNSDDRNKIHLAAVFVNNFTNANLIAAKEVLDHYGIQKFEYLIPILNQTAEKVLTNNPKDCQTGPAIRGDQDVIDHHLNMLKDIEDEKELYVLLNKYIKQKFKK